MTSIFLEKYEKTSRMIIFACRGFSMSGKDTVGNILCNEHGFSRFAFADGLKEIVADKYGCDVPFLHTQEGKITFSTKYGKRWRDILIEEGINQRHQNEDIFANMCVQKIRESEKKRVVITDLRYPNELECIYRSFPNEFIRVIHVYRSGQLRSPVDDESEYLLQERLGDTILINPVTTIDDLRKNIETMIGGFEKDYIVYKK